MNVEPWAVIHSPFNAAERRIRRVLRLTVHTSVLHSCVNKETAEMCVRQIKNKTNPQGVTGICVYTSMEPNHGHFSL